jgi:hypothetical protein
MSKVLGSDIAEVVAARAVILPMARSMKATLIMYFIIDYCRRISLAGKRGRARGCGKYPMYCIAK